MSSLIEVLREIPAEKCHHLKLQLRHPAGAFSVSYSRTVESLREVCVAVSDVAGATASTAEEPNLVPSLERLERFYYHVAEYLDDCRSVLRSLFPSESAFKRNTDQRWFRSAFGVDRAPLESIANVIKHKQGRLRGLWLKGDGLAIPGYYVETAGVATQGPKPGDVRPPTVVLAPDADIHDGETALSLYRACRNHIVSVHTAAAILEYAVRGVLALPREATRPQRLALPATGDLALCTEVVQSLPYLCFIDELLDDEPCVERKGDVVELSRERCGTHEYVSLHRWKASIVWRGDGMTASFKMPYFGQSFVQTVVHALGEQAKVKGCVLQGTPEGRLRVKSSR